MEEFSLKESVGESKPAIKKRSIKTKITYVLLVIIVLIACYLLGYFIGTLLG